MEIILRIRSRSCSINQVEVSCGGCLLKFYKSNFILLKLKGAE